jgi:hypothetical protein
VIIIALPKTQIQRVLKQPGNDHRNPRDVFPVPGAKGLYKLPFLKIGTHHGINGDDKTGYQVRKKRLPKKEAPCKQKSA